MSERGISGQPGCVLSFKHSVLFGSRWSESGRVSAVFEPFFAQTCTQSAWFWAYEHIATHFGIPRKTFKIQNAPRLAQNAPFAHLGASRACQSVCKPVHMAKTRHSGRMFGRKTARKRPKRDRIWFNATESVLAQDPRSYFKFV